MESSRSPQDSDEDNCSSSSSPEVYEAKADELVVRPQQQKKIYVHRCASSHGCSHSNRKTSSSKGVSEYSYNILSDYNERPEVYGREFEKIDRLCQPTYGGHVDDCAQLVRNVNIVDSLPRVGRDNMCMPVCASEQRLVLIHRGLESVGRGGGRGGRGREGGGGVAATSSAISRLPPEGGTRAADLVETCYPCQGRQPPSHMQSSYPSNYFPSPHASSCTCYSYPNHTHSSYPPTATSSLRNQYLPPLVYPTAHANRISATANLLASLGPPQPPPPPPPPPSPPSEASSTILTSEGQVRDPTRFSEAITPTFRQYCRHFFLETLCPGVTESEVQQVVSHVRCLEDRVYLYNAKSKMDYCYQLATKLCCIQEELQQMSKVSQQGMPLLEENKDGGPS